MLSIFLIENINLIIIRNQSTKWACGTNCPPKQRYKQRDTKGTHLQLMIQKDLKRDFSPIHNIRNTHVWITLSTMFCFSISLSWESLILFDLDALHCCHDEASLQNSESPFISICEPVKPCKVFPLLWHHLWNVKNTKIVPNEGQNRTVQTVQEQMIYVFPEDLRRTRQFWDKHINGLLFWILSHPFSFLLKITHLRNWTFEGIPAFQIKFQWSKEERWAKIELKNG